RVRVPVPRRADGAPLQRHYMSAVKPASGGLRSAVARRVPSPSRLDQAHRRRRAVVRAAFSLRRRNRRPALGGGGAADERPSADRRRCLVGGDHGRDPPPPPTAGHKKAMRVRLWELIATTPISCSAPATAGSTSGKPPRSAASISLSTIAPWMPSSVSTAIRSPIKTSPPF